MASARGEGNLEEGRNENGSQESWKAGEEGEETRKREATEPAAIAYAARRASIVQQEPAHVLVFRE